MKSIVIILLVVVITGCFSGYYYPDQDKIYVSPTDKPVANVTVKQKDFLKAYFSVCTSNTEFFKNLNDKPIFDADSPSKHGYTQFEKNILADEFVILSSNGYHSSNRCRYTIGAKLKPNTEYTLSIEGETCGASMTENGVDIDMNANPNFVQNNVNCFELNGVEEDYRLTNTHNYYCKMAKLKISQMTFGASDIFKHIGSLGFANTGLTDTQEDKICDEIKNTNTGKEAKERFESLVLEYVGVLNES